MTNRIGDRTGQQFGNYQLQYLIGQGGFADVYLGEHLYLKTQVAVKVLHTHLAQEDQDSFLTEARTIAHLKHPNTLSVLEFGLAEGTPYLIMDYAPHGSLRERYHTHPLPSPITLLPHMKQVAAALQYAHQAHVIHRDVKPENLLLGPHDEVLLSDFGLALGTQSSRTQNMQEISGTIAYMAPELLQGRPVPASDQYALGVVLYELLSGHLPFHGTFSEIASQHLLTPPPPLSSPAVSPEVEAVIFRALAKNPAQRFTSIQDFVTAFEQATLEVGETFRASSGWLPPGVYQHLPTVPSIASQPTFHENYENSLPTSTPLPTASPILALPPPPTKIIRPRRTLSCALASALLILASLVAISGLTLAYIRFHNGSSTPVPTQTTSTPSQLPGPAAWQQKYAQVTSSKPFFSDPLISQDSSQWDSGSELNRRCLFQTGSYHVSSLTPYNIALCSDNKSTVDLPNLVYQVQLTILRGNEAGLAFRLTLPSPTQVQTYFFTINRDGTYALWALSHSFKILLHQHSSTILTQLNQPNLLTIIAQGKQIALFINQHYIASIIDTSATTGRIALLARALPDTTDVAFHDLKIWRL